MTPTEVNNAAKALLETQFSQVEVSGEISKFDEKNGNWYITLKDENSAIPAVIFHPKVAFSVKVGMKVSVFGKLTIYPSYGRYQIQCFKIMPIGAGELDLAYRQLLERLRNEGLFDESHKKPLPQFPKKVAIITSLGSAAAADIKRQIASKEFFICEFYFFNSLVQGQNAPTYLMKALNTADNMDFDAIIIARGGGSKEDLWCFNDVDLAYAIYNAKTPIISAIGHEIDYSISDFVADHRSITPTASVDDLIPDISFIRDLLDKSCNDLNKLLNNKISNCQNILHESKLKLKTIGIKQRLERILLELNNKKIKIQNILNLKINNLDNKLIQKQTILNEKQRFFEITKNLVSLQKDGKAICLENLQIGDEITISSQSTTKKAKIIK